MSSESKYVYMNYSQLDFRLCHGKINYIVDPRRTGKTAGKLAPYMHAAQKSLPLGTGIFTGNTRKQILGRTLPAVFSSWRSMWGLVEGVNYCPGRPPKKLNYPEPIFKPQIWENTVSFANGFYWMLGSLAVIGSTNGVTADVAAGDECKFFNYERVTSEIIPCISGTNNPYDPDSRSMSNVYYRGQCWTTDASLSAKGNWVERKEETLEQKIEDGRFSGCTNREIKERLLQYARRVTHINEVCYNARKTKHKVQWLSDERAAYASQLKDMCSRREGKFRVLRDGSNSESNCKALVNLGVLSPEDAELLFNADYVLSKEDWIWMQVAQTPKFKKELNDMRCSLTGFWRGSTIDNISLLGESYIKQMRLSLSPLVYAISILGIKVKRSSEGFYYALDIEKHGYIDADDNGVIDNSIRTKKVSNVYNGMTYTGETESPDFEQLASVNDCRMDGDVHEDDQLFIAGDWNSRINWLVVGVVRLDPDTMTQTLYVVNSIFVKAEEGKLDTLLKKFNSYYAPHRRKNRKITFFYDATAKHKGYALEGQEDFKDVVIRYLRASDWDIVAIDMGRPMAHTAKYQDINNAFAGLSYPAIRINREKNEDLIVSLENADVKQGPFGWEKDKSGEKLPYNPDLDDDAGSSVAGSSSASANAKKSNIREEWRTDGSDAFDSLYIGVKYFRYGGGEVFSCF